MQTSTKSIWLLISAASLAACGQQTEQAANEASAPAPTHYKPVASLRDIMRGPINLATEEYWGSVSIIVDRDGVHENRPEDDLEWFEVWSAAMTIAESGNLLMMPPRLVDEGEWVRLATELVDVGVKAAQVAAAQDFEGVLSVGEEVYNVCVECHQTYVPALPDL